MSLGENQGIGRVVFLSVGSRGESLHFQLLDAACMHSLTCGPLLHLQSQQHGISDHSSLIVSSSDHNGIGWSHPDNPGLSSQLKSLTLITCANSLFLWKVTYLQVPGIRMWTYLVGEGTIILYTTVINSNSQTRKSIWVINI